MFYAHARAGRTGRRGHLPRPRLPDLRVDDRASPAAKAVPHAAAARRNDSASTSTSWRADHAAHEADHPQLARTTPPAASSPRADLERSPSVAAPAGHRRPGRRDLRRHGLRGRARLDRVAAGHGRAHDRPRRLLQDLRDDRLAAWATRIVPPEPRRRVQQADHQQRLLHERLPAGRAVEALKVRRTRSTRWPPSSAPARPHRRWAERDSRHQLPRRRRARSTPSPTSAAPA